MRTLRGLLCEARKPVAKSPKKRRDKGTRVASKGANDARAANDAIRPRHGQRSWRQIAKTWSESKTHHYWDEAEGRFATYEETKRTGRVLPSQLPAGGPKPEHSKQYQDRVERARETRRSQRVFQQFKRDLHRLRTQETPGERIWHRKGHGMRHEERVDEISRDALLSYVRRAGADKHERGRRAAQHGFEARSATDGDSRAYHESGKRWHTNKMRQRERGIESATRRVAEGRVDEISRSTLERYGDRARASHRKLARAVDDSERRRGGPRAYANYDKKFKKMVRRETGIRRANDRLVGPPGTLDYHWGRAKPARRTKSGHYEPYHHRESVLGEMSFRLLDRYVKRAEGDPSRRHGVARARLRMDVKRLNFRDPMREDAAVAPAPDEKTARALRLKRLLAMASQSQQGVNDQTRRPTREERVDEVSRAKAKRYAQAAHSDLVMLNYDQGFRQGRRVGSGEASAEHPTPDGTDRHEIRKRNNRFVGIKRAIARLGEARDHPVKGQTWRNFRQIRTAQRALDRQIRSSDERPQTTQGHKLVVNRMLALSGKK